MILHRNLSSRSSRSMVIVHKTKRIMLLGTILSSITNLEDVLEQCNADVLFRYFKDLFR